jgi:hypothetical protein
LNPRFLKRERGFVLEGEDYEESDAIDAFSKAIQLDPKLAQAYYSRGIEYGQWRGKHAECMTIPRLYLSRIGNDA